MSDYPDGLITEMEAKYLEEMAGLMPNDSLIVEVGAYKGRSTVALGRGAIKSQSMVVSIDWGEGSLEDGWTQHQFMLDYQDEYLANLKSYGVDRQVSPIFMDSRQVVKLWKFGLINMLWIDGTHKESHLVEELHGFRRWLTEPGLVLLHDWGTFPEVETSTRKVYPDLDFRQVEVCGSILTLEGI